MRLPVLLIAGLLASSAASAEVIRVAVASNFRQAVDALAERFERDTGHEVVVIPGSTGKHFAQIENGAPFDVFLAADEERPRLLEERQLAVPGSRFTYAIGKLALWSPREAYIDGSSRRIEEGQFRFLAIANPVLAPYGRAARQVLEALGVWEAQKARIVRGENIAQAFQFVATGNASLGFVAWSQILSPDGGIRGSYWSVPQAMHDPIRQQAVLITGRPGSRAFADFLSSEAARNIIGHFGYELP